MRRAFLLVTLLAIAGCSLGQTPPSATTSPSATTVSPSPSSGPLLLGLWVLSPIGVKLRDQPSTSGNQVATIPQGAKLTATAKQGADPVWYQVTYNTTPGWIAASLPASNPTPHLVTPPPHLSLSTPPHTYSSLSP